MAGERGAAGRGGDGPVRRAPEGCGGDWESARQLCRRHCARRPSCRCSRATQPALAEVNILFWLLGTGTVRGPIPKQQSLQPSDIFLGIQGSQCAARLVPVTHEVYRPTLTFGSFVGSHFLDVSVMASRCQALLSAAWWSPSGKSL